MKARIIYGPILSRRLGRSLGVDVIKKTGTKKNCNFDCVYCQLGHVENKINGPEEVEGAVITEEVVEGIRSFHRNIENLDYVTFSGTCEPTLNLSLGSMIKGVKQIITQPVCVLTNSSLVNREDVRSNLAEADLVIATLVSGNEDTFRAIHRPVDGIRLDNIIKGLQAIKNLEKRPRLGIEVMLVDSTNGYPVNSTDEEITKLMEVLKIIDPDEIEILTVSRPPAEKFIAPVAEIRLKEIAHRFDEEFGKERVKLVLKGLKRERSSMQHENLEEEIYDLVLRRPCTSKQICSSLGISSAELTPIMEKLISSNSIICIMSTNGTYYKAS
ncbi:MAG: molybdenum cofactor biosynthesis protein A [Methanomethylovorans sp. PtaU1.Bin073]|jgi:wyosine [tRNA(Phe)-imidazoG37] synthetase (radical SAM superfamily)|nr:MAG: molybdenum cofactor biosynthesis protein A [Methanomethylovorans sp. PtaU1.Bin073]